jgi:hypothetical protein
MFPAGLAVCLGAFFATACAARPGNPSSVEIDAVLPAQASWTLFRLGGLRYARVPAATQAWTDTGASADGSARSGMPPGIRWLAIPSPEGAFRPVQALSAARGYFYLLDGASSRLCLYDSAAGLISTFPLPERFTPFASGRVAVFRGADGTFVFADYAAGEAFLYSDREGAEGARAWMLRGRTKMPVGWRDCTQPPGGEEIYCRSGGSALRFDGALNRIPAHAARPAEDPALTGASEAPSSRLFWDASAREWVLEGWSADKTPLFHFYPARRRLEPIVSK